MSAVQVATSSAGPTTTAATIATTTPSSVATATSTTTTSATTTAETSVTSTATTTTATTTTATTTTATSTTTATTTTTSTTSSTSAAATAAANAAHAAAQLQSQFHETIKQANNCLIYIRRLRAQMVNTQEEVLAIKYKKRTKSSLEIYQRIERMTIDVKLGFERVEMCARKFPATIPQVESLGVMKSLYSEEHYMEQRNVTKTLEGMIDAGNWNEGQYQTFYYLSEFLRNSNNKRRSILLTPRIIPPITYSSGENAGHRNFENAFRGMKKEIAAKSLGIYPRIIKSNSTSMIVEIKFGVAGPDKNDKNIVHTMKYLLIEKSGLIEYINVIAPNEELYADCDFGEKMVDATKPSRFKVYRAMTKQANINLLNSFGNANRWTSQTLTQFVTIFGKMREVFGTRCHICKKILRDFQPPMVFDIRMPSNAIHEHCK